jgi:hypothetical protein
LYTVTNYTDEQPTFIFSQSGVKAPSGYTGRMTSKVIIQYNGRGRRVNYGYNGKNLEAIVACITVAESA